MSTRPTLLRLLTGLLCLAGNCLTLAGQTSLEVKMRAFGLVDLQQIDSTIVVDLMYAGEDNFMGEELYDDLTRAYLAPDFARRLVRAQQLLREERGDRFALIIYDAARPLSIQQRMWERVRSTPHRVYVAPASSTLGGRHNYGVAVDLSILDRETGRPLDMGSPVDHFGPTAHIGGEEELVRQGEMTGEALGNRRYLHRLMHRVGLRPIRKEWWHFQEPCPIEEVRRTRRLLDF